MDWARAIERNSEALKAIVAALFVMLGSATVARIPRPLHRAVLSVLRPAEAAARRLIVIAARGLVVKPAAACPMPKGCVIKRGQASRSAFQLFDPRKRFAPQRRSSGRRAKPRILTFWPDPHLVPLWQPQPTFAPVKPPDDGHVDASRLSRRLNALKLALDDLPRQAKRLVRLRAKREKLPSLALKSPLRPGRPPGHRKIPLHEVHHVLAECHGLARDVLAYDTS
jgi:hypothetical protein